MKSWELHLGPWALVDAPLPGPCVVISDPPYDERTHKGRRTGSSNEGIAYNALTPQAARIAVDAFVERWAPEWIVLFGSHVTWQWFAEALDQAGQYVFAPVPWVKPDGIPRMQGDGPACNTEWLCIARPRTRVTRPGSRPGFYVEPVGTKSPSGTIVGGQKPLAFMRKLVLDYSAPGQLVIDPFAGSGTTLLAALLEGRRAWGAEIDPSTHARAVHRIQAEHDAQPALFTEVQRGTQQQLFGKS